MFSLLEACTATASAEVLDAMWICLPFSDRMELLRVVRTNRFAVLYVGRLLLYENCMGVRWPFARAVAGN